VTVEEFAKAVAYIRRKYSGWETSRGRSDRHAVDVGGFAGDPHTWDLGSDMLYAVQPPLDKLQQDAQAVGLRVIRETGKPHDHYQPLDFPSGPVHNYAGEEKTWA
jgi:hypothetical protein